MKRILLPILAMATFFVSCEKDKTAASTDRGTTHPPVSIDSTDINRSQIISTWNATNALLVVTNPGKIESRRVLKLFTRLTFNTDNSVTKFESDSSGTTVMESTSDGTYSISRGTLSIRYMYVIGVLDFSIYITGNKMTMYSKQVNGDGTVVETYLNLTKA
jgi:hypothetical protein